MSSPFKNNSPLYDSNYLEVLEVGPEPKQEKNRPNKTNRGIQLLPGFVCFAQRYKHPGQYSFRTCFVWRNKHAGGWLLGVCFARTNKQARIPHVSLVYLHKHSQYPAYANANAHEGVLFPLPFGPKRTLPIKKMAYVTILLNYISHAHISYQANVHCAEHSSVSVYLTLGIFSSGPYQGLLHISRISRVVFFAIHKHRETVAWG